MPERQLTPIQRKVHLLERGVTVSRLARETGLEKQRGNVSSVIHNRLRSDRIEAAICEFLGVDRDEWFGPRSTDAVDQAA